MFEYLLLPAPGVVSPEWEIRINTTGKAGWELICTDIHGNLIFKRPKGREVVSLADIVPQSVTPDEKKKARTRAKRGTTRSKKSLRK